VATSEQESRPFAWVSLEPDDAYPARFWSYVIEAISRVQPGFGETLRVALSGSINFERVVMTPFINELASLPRRIVVVLDDIPCPSPGNRRLPIGEKGAEDGRIVFSSAGPALASLAGPPSSSRSRCVWRPTKSRSSAPAGEVAPAAPSETQRLWVRVSKTFLFAIYWQAEF
jgi:hypothetical protein